MWDHAERIPLLNVNDCPKAFGFNVYLLLMWVGLLFGTFIHSKTSGHAIQGMVLWAYTTRSGIGSIPSGVEFKAHALSREIWVLTDL